MDEDIPLPVDLPAGALKLAWWQVSCLQAVNDRFQSGAITGRANREWRLSTQQSRSQWVLRTAVLGQEEPFQMQTLSDREAPIPDLPALAPEREASTLSGHRLDTDLNW
jgi:hypothetical protein